MKYLITGGCGFVGSNLAQEVLRRGEELVIFDNLYRLGSEKNLEWLKQQGEFVFYRSDIRNADDVSYVVEKEMPDVIFHVAGQVAMTTSLDRPRFDFEINVNGTFNLLEAVRKFCPKTPIFYSSTNKVYGDLEKYDYEEQGLRYVNLKYPQGLPESIPLDFRTPYGCSKGAADQYMKDYYLCYGIKTVTFRHSSIFGGRQFSSFDQGWIGWFAQQAINVKNNQLKGPFTISGNGKQVRDVLFADDLVSCYFSALDHIDQIAGEAFNIGGGIDNSLSLLELFGILERELDISLNYRELEVRKSDQKFFVADISKAKELFHWIPKTDKVTGIKRMIDWIKEI